ncbi:MAG: SusC/RagA family TonB-linked outer membrane protein [Gemmatimonadaceae bacterium]|nr:SusC/RagA family TonB-linked outer membrane protein [Gemmatimonadaceae bacterium]
MAASTAAAQGGTINGRVTTDAGAPLQLVSVSAPEHSVGAYTRDDGTYSITIPAARFTAATLNVTVTARRVGYAPTTVVVSLARGGTATQDFILTALPSQLTGVVITALGVEKEKSQLGTAQTQLSTSELTTSQDPSLVNLLSGKVSGVMIAGAGTQEGSANIRIRGSNSITGNNEPLWIVDGVPILNINRGSGPNGTGATSGGGADFGSVISDLNPEDIATMTVLKGPNAAALYGSRAANGVIVVTTKRGSASAGKIVTNISTDYSFQTPGVFPSYQNLYGQGAGGQFKFVDGMGGGIQDGNDQSYGPRLNGQAIDQFTGKAMPWVAHPNNVASFFNVGRQLNTNISFSGGNDRSTVRLAFGNENVDGMIPNSFWRKFNANLNGSVAVTPKFSVQAAGQYIRNEGLNRPGTGYNTGILEQFTWFGRQVDMAALKARQYNDDGSLFNWNYNFHNNPYYLQYDNPEKDQRDNIIGSLSGTYQLNSWLTLAGRQSLNLVRQNINQNWAKGNINFADPNYSGAFTYTNQVNSETNSELLLTANRQLGTHFSMNGTAGANTRFAAMSNNMQSTAGISVPGIYNVSNAAITPTLAQRSEARQVNSVYGSLSFTFNDWWTVEGTARNDWSSTLPKGNNSYFYPSLNTSVVLTDAIPALRSSVLSYLKLRASTAEVGADAGPYQLATPYNGSSAKFGSQPLYSLSSTIFNAELKPEITRSNEGGIEASFFDGRITADASYYRKSTKNQIVQVTVSPASGFINKWLNAGQIDNWGIEALISAELLRYRGVEWNTTFNYSQNRSSVVSLAQGLKTYVLGTAWAANVEARVNGQYGVIYGYTMLRDSATKQLLLSDGLAQFGPRQVLGGINPTWVGGWGNSLKYKWLTLSALLDLHRGGNIFSITNMFGEYAGVLSATTKGREVDWDTPGIVAQGIDEATGKPNTVKVTSEEWFQNLFQMHEAYVYDASYTKLREVRLTIDLPTEWSQRLLHSQAASLAIIGRNVATWAKVPNIDPEFSYSTGNSQGMEFGSLPNPKSIGFSLRVTP